MAEDTNPLSEYQKLVQDYTGATNDLKSVLTQPQSFNIASVLAKMAQPTPTGQFDFGAGGAELGRQQQEIEKLYPQNLATRVSLLKSQMDLAKQAGVRNVAQNLLKPVQVTDEKGNLTTNYTVNPQAINNIMQLSDNPLEDLSKYASTIPNLKKAGLLGSKTTEGTPFDALAMMVEDPLIKKQAENYANQYKSGTMDDEKANALAEKMIQLYSTNMNAKEQRNFQAAFHNLSAVIAQGNLDIRRSEEKRKIEEEKKKLTDEQKIDYKNRVLPVLDQAKKATDAIFQLEDLRNSVNELPTSIIENVQAYRPGSKYQEPVRNIDRITSSLITTIPRLPGSQSNLDSQNLKLSLGKLSDPLLKRADKIKLLDKIEAIYKRLENTGSYYESYWEKNKKVPPIIVNLEDIPSEKGK
jgi:hypothetical protein